MVPNRTEEYSTTVDLEGKTYLIETEDLGTAKHSVITRTLLKGKVISFFETDYGDILDKPGFERKLGAFMKRQQERALENLKLDVIEQRKPYRDYIKDAEVLIRIDSEKEALALLKGAKEYYPNNPMISSYRGLLEAVVNKNYSEGISLCEQAITMLRKSMPIGESFFLPVLYLNLGKAYMAANRKKQAHDSFRKGVELDHNNRDFLAELRRLGIRKRSPLPFLKRANPINKYLGKLRHILTSQ